MAVGYTCRYDPATIDGVVAVNLNPDQLQEVYLLQREYEAALSETCDSDDRWRLRRILLEIRACIVQSENG